MGNNTGPTSRRAQITFPDGSKKDLLAHRFMYLLHTNTIHVFHDKHISHICHNSLCRYPLPSSLEDAFVKGTWTRF